MYKYCVICLIGVLVGMQGLSCTPKVLTNLSNTKLEESGDRLSGSLEIDPDSRFVSGNLIYSHVVSEKERTDGLSFFIPKDFKVSKVSGKYIDDYEMIIDTSSYIGQFLKTIHIQLDHSVVSNALLDISFEYAGTVDLRGFAELDYPTPWIEVSPNTLMLTPIPVEVPEARYNLRIKLPSEYQIVSPGKSLPGNMGETIVDSQDYIKGVYFIIGKDLDIDHLKYKSTRTQLVSYQVPQSMKDRIGKMVGHTIDLYNTSFGTSNRQNQVTIALRPSDEWDASFAAGSNYFVSYDSQSDFITKEQDYYATYAHEMAHFWWKEADALTNSNWLNEGFAEFSSLLAIKSFYGQEAFDRKIKYHQSIFNKVPEGNKLGNYERFGKHDQAMSYSAGALLLNEIYNELGQDKFNQFLSDVLVSKIRNTEQFVDYLIQNQKGVWLDDIISKI